ncbi:uncharacterized protein LOC123535176 [Mercenaria mercenaria]|uniref:uncharacterized protein LOC123535176 n=1 Tax=Mercenaria mercenaria TaxID=6596 RepID=UPI00234F35AC|nr:uncharacterized protein LOC123535176 [Mercenaria mercenaria]
MVLQHQDPVGQTLTAAYYLKKYCRLTMKQIILLTLILHTNDALGQFFNKTVTLPEAAKNEIEECYNIGVSQNVPAEDLWQVQLACLSEYYKNLNANNITSDNMKPFIDAENNR